MRNTSINYARILAVIIILCGIVYFYANLFAPRLIPKLLRIGTTRKPTTVLILGTDVTYNAETGKPIAGSEGRTDSILLAKIDPVDYKINILSIPRDSFVEVPGYGWMKINASNVLGGVELVKKTLFRLTGENIDYFIEVNPHAIVRLVDLLGGINLYVEKDMFYQDQAQDLDINLKQGWHKLSGKEVQGYIRFRHDASGDLGRIERQQKFLQTIFKSFARPANLLKASMALEIAAKYIRTDLSLLKMIRLLNFTRMLSRDDIRTFTAPGMVKDSSTAGSIIVLDRQDLNKIIRDYF